MWASKNPSAWRASGNDTRSVRVEDEIDGLTSRRPDACVRSPIGLRLDAAGQSAADVPLLHRQDPQAVGSDLGLTPGGSVGSAWL